MATLSNPTFFKGGVEGGPQLVGYTKAASDDSFSNYVLRYTLTIEPNESGNHIRVEIETLGYLEWSSADTQYKVNNAASLYFKIGTDPTEFANAGYAQSLEVPNNKVNMISTGDLNYDVAFEADVLFLPGQTYYVWIFPGFAASGEPNGNYTVGYFEWYGLSKHVHKIELSGAAGIVKLKIGTDIMNAIPLIGSGGEWKSLVPLLGNAGKWNNCG